MHDSLSAKQMQQVTQIYNTFAEVNPSTLEETVSNFKRDQNPDNEIAVWLKMAKVYEDFISTLPSPTSLDKKREVYKLIVLRSMMPGEEAQRQAQLKFLTDGEAKFILTSYNAPPKPISVVPK